MASRETGWAFHHVSYLHGGGLFFAHQGWQGESSAPVQQQLLHQLLFIPDCTIGSVVRQ